MLVEALLVVEDEELHQRGDALAVDPEFGVIRGDGTGPEVVGEALKVLEAVRPGCDLVDLDLGADRFLRTGDVLPEADLERLRGCDASTCWAR